MVAVVALTFGALLVGIWWICDDALASYRQRQRQQQREAISLARINLLNGGARQALREEALLHRLGELNFDRLSDRL